MSVKPIPDGFHTLSPYLILKDALQFIEFLKHAFKAQEVVRSVLPNGTLTYAELKIGDSHLMLTEARDELKPMPSSFYLYVPDTDAVYKEAIKAGATSTSEPADQFYGDRIAGVIDPFGNRWWIGTHIEDVSPEEIKKRAQAFYANQNRSIS
jgi:PhnB protein